MVLEHIFPEDWLEQKTKYAFLLGAGYSILGILIAKILFPKDSGLVSVAFISLLLLPELYKIFSIEERQEMMETQFSFKELFRDDWDVVKIYIFLFLGVLLVFTVGTLVLPPSETNRLFEQQLEIRGNPGHTGQLAYEGVFADEFTFTGNLFWNLLKNNFRVLLACFLIALLTGDGAIFIITWNASVWGTIFGITARHASEYAQMYPAQAVLSYSAPLMILIIFLIVFWHMIIEAIADFCAAISGSIISKDVLLEKFESDRFKMVFKFNLYLFLIALVFLVLGALVETIVLDNVAIYGTIIEQSLAFFGA